MKKGYLLLLFIGVLLFQIGCRSTIYYRIVHIDKEYQLPDRLNIVFEAEENFSSSKFTQFQMLLSKDFGRAVPVDKYGRKGIIWRDISKQEWSEASVNIIMSAFKIPNEATILADFIVEDAEQNSLLTPGTKSAALIRDYFQMQLDRLQKKNQVE
jgi:hypothetical protein